MLATRDAYVLGFTPRILGLHFDGLEILANAQRGASGELATRVKGMLDAWPSRGPAAVANVRKVEAILKSVGLATPSPPRNTEEYYAWGKTVLEAVNGLLADRAELTADVRLALFQRKWANTVGSTIGDALETLNLLAIVHHLLDAAPSQGFLGAQAASLEQGLATLRTKLATILERVTFLHAFEQPALLTIGRAMAVLEHLATTRAGATHAGAVAAYQAAMNALADCDVAAMLPAAAPQG